MTKKQKKEALSLFEISLEGIPEAEHEEYLECFRALDELMQKFETIANDCIFAIAHNMELDAEARGERESERTFRDAELDAMILLGQPFNA